MPIYEVIKRHGEVYAYRGQKCIVVATAEGEREMEALVARANAAVGTFLDPDQPQKEDA